MPYKTSHMYMRNLQMEQDTRQKQRYLRCHSSSPIRLVALYLCMPYRCLRMPCSVLFVFPLCHWCAGRKDRQRGPSSGWLPPCTRQWRQLHCVIILWASTSQTLCLCAPCPCLRVPCSACLSCMLLTQSLYCRTMGTIKCGEWPNPINVPSFPTFQYCRQSIADIAKLLRMVSGANIFAALGWCTFACDCSGEKCSECFHFFSKMRNIFQYQGTLPWPELLGLFEKIIQYPCLRVLIRST